MDCIVHGVTESQTRRSDFHFLRNRALDQGCAVKCTCRSEAGDGSRLGVYSWPPAYISRGKKRWASGLTVTASLLFAFPETG